MNYLELRGSGGNHWISAVQFAGGAPYLPASPAIAAELRGGGAICVQSGRGGVGEEGRYRRWHSLILSSPGSGAELVGGGAIWGSEGRR
jgi:hypothetical protein